MKMKKVEIMVTIDVGDMMMAIYNYTCVLLLLSNVQVQVKSTPATSTSEQAHLEQ